MTHGPNDRLGSGPLTVRTVFDDAVAMLGQSFARIAIVAAVVFALPAILAESIDHFLTGNTDQGPIALGLVLATVAVAVVLSTFGPIFFSGFLDEAVGQEYFEGHRRSIAAVLRSLPWGRLVVADIIVTFVVSFGLWLFVLPGLIAYGLLGLIGPIVVRERAGIRASFRRTIALARSRPTLVTVLVVIPFAFEEVIHTAILEAFLHDYGVTVQIAAEWIVAILVGGMLGLLEVALASELMARNPLPRAEPEHALLDDGQTPAV